MLQDVPIRVGRFPVHYSGQLVSTVCYQDIQECQSSLFFLLNCEFNVCKHLVEVCMEGLQVLLSMEPDDMKRLAMMGDRGNPWVYRQFVQRSCSGIGNRLILNTIQWAPLVVGRGCRSCPSGLGPWSLSTSPINHLHLLHQFYHTWDYSQPSPAPHSSVLCVHISSLLSSQLSKKPFFLMCLSLFPFFHLINTPQPLWFCLMEFPLYLPFVKQGCPFLVPHFTFFSTRPFFNTLITSSYTSSSASWSFPTVITLASSLLMASTLPYRVVLWDNKPSLAQ